MIHQYKNNGYNIVLDVYSGAVHVVDDLCYDVIAVLNEPDEEPTAEILKSDLTWENLKKRLGDTYSEEDLISCSNREEEKDSCKGSLPSHCT